MLDLSARSAFYRELGSLLQAGLLPDRALEHAGRTTSRRIGAAALQSAAAKVRSGAPLAEALDLGKVRVPASERAALAAAERGGALPRLLAALAERLDARATTLRAIAASTAYPLLVLHVAALAVSVPALASGAGSFLARWLLLTLLLDGALVGVVALVRWRLAASAAPDLWPFLGRLFRAAHNAEYLETLALLYGGGVPIGESHALAAAAVARAPVRRALERAAAGLRGGLGLAPSLAATGVMDPMVLGMIANGEATGGLEEALVQAAALLREAELRDLRRAATLAGGILYAIAVVVVIVVVFRFYSTLLGRLR